MMDKNTNKMSEFMEKEYAKSLDFWNDWLGQEEENDENLNLDTAWYEIGSKVLAEAAAELATQKQVLDYGCGSGWASVIMVKRGCPHVTAVDVSENGVKAAIQYAETFHVKEQITFLPITTQWLKQQQPDSYDGFFCSNVLDVVPTPVCEAIIKSAANVCKKGAKVIIGLNPYFEQELIEKKGFEEREKNHLFYKDILRIVNHSDEEWTTILGTYFKVVELRHFHWDGEPDTVNRRIFVLEKE